MSKPTDDKPAPPSIELSGSIWLSSGTQNWGTERRMSLLAAIGESGSISAAAKRIGLSYKAAWDAVDTMNNLAGEPLVLGTSGGQGGGGARLTPRAHELIVLYHRINKEHERFIKRLSAASSRDLELIQNMMIQTSARNQLPGAIAVIKPGQVNDEVILNIADGLHIVATITHESVQALGLVPGKRALAFIKASSIIIGRPEGALRLSARNQLAGRISRILEGAVNAEVSLALKSGHTISAIISKEGLSELALSEGQDAYAIFKASSVMLGVLD